MSDLTADDAIAGLDPQDALEQAPLPDTDGEHEPTPDDTTAAAGVEEVDLDAPLLPDADSDPLEDDDEPVETLPAGEPGPDDQPDGQVAP